MSKIEVNTVEPQCGTTLTLGASGDTVQLGSGASQSGFGRTGTVDWVTTPKVTGDSPVTAVSGKGYFLNTTAGTITINLPAGAAGAIVSLADYAGTWQTYNVTVSPNGSEKISGAALDAVLNTQGQSVTLVYVDAVQGWITTADSSENIQGASYIAATGGTPTTCGDYKIHTFTAPGTLCVSAVGNPAGSDKVEYIVVAGGGGGGGKFCSSSGGAGGGAGGFRFAATSLASACYPAKPLAAPANLPVSVQGYPIAVGGGGAGGGTPSGSCVPGSAGVDSTFSTITSAGGGAGAGGGGAAGGTAGGSGGGTPDLNPGTPCGTALAGNTPPVSPPQGFPGGAAGPPGNHSSGGGGATVAGSVVGSTGGPGGAGGGLPTAFGSNGEPCGSYRYYAGGGGGGGYNCGANGQGGVGGGGNAKTAPGSIPSANGTDNTGGGAGGVGAPGVGNNGGTGGSGIVIIRYKFQN